MTVTPGIKLAVHSFKSSSAVPPAMAAFEWSGPIRAVRLSRLSARRGCGKAEQAERRHGGDAAKETAAGRNVGRMLIGIGHLFLPRVALLAILPLWTPSAKGSSVTATTSPGATHPPPPHIARR